MQRSYNPLVYILVSSFLFLSYGCFPWIKKARVTQKETVKTGSLKPEVKISSIRDMESLYSNINSLEASTSVDISLGEFQQEVNAQIRWIRDSVYWMNFSLLGIEGARLLITKDSLFLVDRINKEYYTNSLEGMANKYNVPISFKNVQAFLLGYPFLLSEEKIVEFRSPDQIHFIQEDARWKTDYFTDSTLTQLNKMNIKQRGGDAYISNTLENYKPQNGYHKFSLNRLLDLYTREVGKGHIRLEIENLEINKPKEIKFSIPSSYERM